MKHSIYHQLPKLLLTSIAALLLTMNSVAVEVIAHRGYSAIAPENTLASMREAWKTDADGIELDIYLTKDNQIIVSHDGNTKRTTGQSYEITSTDSKVLRTLDAGSFKGKQFAGEKLPFLDEILKESPAHKRIFVEIKQGDPKILPYLKKSVNKSKNKANVTFISFNKDVLAQAKKMMPEIPAYWLHAPAKDTTTNKYMKYDETPIKIAKENHFDGVDSYCEGVTPEFVKGVHDAGMKLYVWTIDNPVIVKDMVKLGVDGITTNNPVTTREASK